MIYLSIPCPRYIYIYIHREPKKMLKRVFLLEHRNNSSLSRKFYLYPSSVLLGMIFLLTSDIHDIRVKKDANNLFMLWVLRIYLRRVTRLYQACTQKHRPQVKGVEDSLTKSPRLRKNWFKKVTSTAHSGNSLGRCPWIQAWQIWLKKIIYNVRANVYSYQIYQNQNKKLREFLDRESKTPWR